MTEALRNTGEPTSILLSFDTEEFDLPREHGVDISLEEAMKVSIEGTNCILDILERNSVKATFFCTANFATNAPEVMKRILDGGHEVASHGVDHWQLKDTDTAISKDILEEICHCPINGYREPRMFPVDDQQLEHLGYKYNSSLHPAFIPGRYMHLTVPRTPFFKGKVLQIPTSVFPGVRLPLFWLACHHYPQQLYRKLCMWTLRHDGLFVIYFHPWEFIPLGAHPEWNIPRLIKHNSGEEMERRLEKLIQSFKEEQANFVTYTQYAQSYWGL
ncbi:MAG: polysaccharide deacetylase family protein [Muribaculaceae bacterium]|nr:polysaccharide deacetylase family protein [Muribaculaceae bacterium]